ncbi:hypothetical protein MNBD_ALPHA06-376, partial [hydrothermal vent metagenome]
AANISGIPTPVVSAKPGLIEIAVPGITNLPTPVKTGDAGKIEQGAANISGIPTPVTSNKPVAILAPVPAVPTAVLPLLVQAPQIAPASLGEPMVLATNTAPPVAGTPLNLPTKPGQKSTAATAGPTGPNKAVLPSTSPVAGAAKPVPAPVLPAGLLHLQLQNKPESGFELDIATDKLGSVSTTQQGNSLRTDSVRLPSIANAEPASRIGAEAVSKFAARLAAKAVRGSSKIEMRLDPPQLGRIEVKMEMSSDNRVQAVMTVESPDVLLDLQKSADSLRRALVQEGFDLDNGSLEFQLEQQGTGAGEQDFDQTEPTTPAHLNQLMDDALLVTATEIDTGHGYLLVPDQRLDIKA